MINKLSMTRRGWCGSREVSASRQQVLGQFFQGIPNFQATLGGRGREVEGRERERERMCVCGKCPSGEQSKAKMSPL